MLFMLPFSGPGRNENSRTVCKLHFVRLRSVDSQSFYCRRSNYESQFQQQKSYSSSESDSSDTRVPKYNSTVIGRSTRSLIQQVFLDEDLPQLAQDSDIVSLTGSEIANSFQIDPSQLENAADEV